MFRRFWESESGNYAAIFAVATVPVMAGVAGAIDFTSALTKADQLQNSLDAAALAIATKYFSGMTDDQLTTVGLDYFDTNMAGILVDAEQFEFDDELPSDLSAIASAEGDEDFITVRSDVTHQGIIGSLDWNIDRLSVVKIKKGPPACVLAIDPHASSSVKIQGSSQVGMVGCVIASNSDSSTSVYRGGSAALNAECINTVGETSGVSGTISVQLECSGPMEKQYPSFDPLANVVPPSYTGCQPVQGGKTKSLSPGTFCDKTLSGDITLEPGTYILRGGRINLGGNGSLVGSGVTIFLMEDAEFSINGNEIVQLTPPTTGPYAGITIYQEKSNVVPVTINGTSGSEVSGFVYAPGAHIFYAGTSATMTLSACLRLVGNTIEMSGNSAMKSDCSAELGGRSMFAGRYMSIVR